MRVHRFYLPPETELKHDFWLHDGRLINQWRKVLRFKTGQELVLFDGSQHERLYRLGELTDREAHLQLVTDFVRKTPGKEIFLFWSLLKKDKNDWVLQKATEVGVSHFIPLLADRSEKSGFDADRARRILIEASEQCGRSDIPAVREPMGVATALTDYKDKIHLLVCEQEDVVDRQGLEFTGPIGLLIGPEGGWSDPEKQLFSSTGLPHIALHDFTLRAETAAIVALARIS